jgi:hypothetical protein
MQSNTKNNAAWQILFEKYEILRHVERHGSYRITAPAINELREARLMTKFDHRINLPAIFRSNNLTIQPDSRGSYLIGHFSSYQKVSDEPTVPIKEVPYPAVETIDPDNLYSESAALLCAYNAGIISDVLEEEVRFTVSGRMSTGQFSYLIKDDKSGTLFRISVNNSQCEIDAGFEGPSLFALLEAKNYSVDDFLVRQLYYPYRLWRTKTSKRVVPVFMSFTNDTFSFHLYRFNDPEQYNSIELIAQKKYQVVLGSIELSDIYALLQQVSVRPEPQHVPFPQADNFNRIVDLLRLLYANVSLSQEQITSNYAFDVRQTQYYTRAAMYLGLVERHIDKSTGVTYSLTALGNQVMKSGRQKRNLAIIKQILEHQVFSQALALYFTQSRPPTTEQIMKIMKSAQLELDLHGHTTIKRRAQTVLSWIHWILGLQVDKGE